MCCAVGSAGAVTEIEITRVLAQTRATLTSGALRSLKRHGAYPCDGLVPKAISGSRGKAFDYAITLMRLKREECTTLPGAEVIRWSFPDPTCVVEGPARESAREFFWRSSSSPLSDLIAGRPAAIVTSYSRAAHTAYRALRESPAEQMTWAIAFCNWDSSSALEKCCGSLSSKRVFGAVAAHQNYGQLWRHACSSAST